MFVVCIVLLILLQLTTLGSPQTDISYHFLWLLLLSFAPSVRCQSHSLCTELGMSRGIKLFFLLIHTRILVLFLLILFVSFTYSPPLLLLHSIYSRISLVCVFSSLLCSFSFLIDIQRMRGDETEDMQRNSHPDLASRYEGNYLCIFYIFGFLWNLHKVTFSAVEMDLNSKI